MDRAYDHASLYAAMEDRDVRPIIPLRATADVKAGGGQAPECDHGRWTFAGAKRGASKWRCPTGECAPASRWIKASRLIPLLPRQTPRWGNLYARRSAVEREFGRLKHEWALPRCGSVGWNRVRLHADLTCLAKLSCALARARAVPLAA